MKRSARFASRWIGPAAFLVLVWYTDLSQVGEIWRNGSPALLAAAAGLNAVIILVKAWRWQRLMRIQGISYDYGPTARYYAIGCALAAWTPGRLGDFSKALAVHRDRKVGLGRAASSVIADRLMDAVMLAAVATVGAVALPGAGGVWLAGAGLVAAVVSAWFLLRTTCTGAARRGAEKLVGAFGSMRRMGRHAGEEVGAALDGLASLARPALSMSAAATCAATLVTFVQGYLVALSLGLDVGFWRLSVALAAVSITSLLPVTVAGFGTREGTLLLFLGPLGIGRHEVLAFSLTYFVIISGSVALMGAAAWALGPSAGASAPPPSLESDAEVAP